MFRTLKKFFAFCEQRERKQFYLSLVFGVLNSMASAMRIPAVFVVLKALFEGVLTAKTAILACGIIVFSIIFQTAVSMKMTMLQTRAGFNMAAKKRIEIAEHLRYVPMGYFNREGLGRVTSIATNTMEHLADIGTRCVMLITKGMITTAVVITSMFVFDWRIASVALAAAVLYLIGTEWMIRFMSATADKSIKAQENMVSRILEYVQGIAEVRNFKLFGKRITSVDDTIDTFARLSVKMELFYEIFMFFLSNINKLTGAAIVVMSAAFYLNGSLSLVYALTMIICSFMIFEALDLVGAFNGLTRTIENCVELGNEALSSPTMNIDGEYLVPKDHALAMKNVDFSYGTRKIIDDVSLSVPEKKAIAFVGPSGGGKTTLTQLLARFWDTDRGSVTLGGTDVKDYSYDSLMKNFSFVFQNVYLFNDTVANNIRFGEPDAPMDRVIEAAKKACCHDFISALPQGYDTVIGEGGATLSGGEKQRISIARAMLKDAPIIILDEATANVDPENEVQLIRAIEALTKEKTIVMIAHRLKTVRHADQILVVDKGKIVQRGTHEELVKRDGLYRRFVEERESAAGWKVTGQMQ